MYKVESTVAKVISVRHLPTIPSPLHRPVFLHNDKHPPKQFCASQEKKGHSSTPSSFVFNSASEVSVMFCLPLCYLHICNKTYLALNQRRFKIFLSKSDSIKQQKGTTKCQPSCLPLYAVGKCCHNILETLVGGKTSGCCLHQPEAVASTVSDQLAFC